MIDRLIRNDEITSRLYESLELASRIADGKAIVKINDEYRNFKQKYVCSDEDFVIPEIENRLFSFNFPIGDCPSCKGLGVKMKLNLDLLLNMDKPVVDGGIVPYRNMDEENLSAQEIEQTAKFYNIDFLKPLKDLSKKN